MLGDTAVAVHPNDERYRHLIGKSVRLPLAGRRIPVIADEHVDPSEVLDEPRHRAGGPQIEGDGALARVGGMEDRREIGEERRAPAPRVVAAVGPLDLHHVGAQPREDLAGERPREILRDLDDLDPRERQRRHGSECREAGAHRGWRAVGTTWLRSALAFTPTNVIAPSGWARARRPPRGRRPGRARTPTSPRRRTPRARTRAAA